MTVRNKVIIWSSDNSNTLGLLREFGSSGLDVFFLIKGRRKYAAKSVYCKEYYETRTVEEGFSYLLFHFKDVNEKPIVITAGDDIISFLDLNRDKLGDRYYLPLTKAIGKTIAFVDKNNMTNLAREIGIMCPDSHMFKWDTPVNGITYPCIIKPSHEKPGHYNEFKFKICNNEKDLLKTLRKVNHESEFIVQEYIKGENEVVVYGARFRDNTVHFAGALIRDRLDESGLSSHGLITSKIPECINISRIEEFLSVIDFVGLFSFEYGIKDNSAYFFEVNLRNDATANLFFQAGASIPVAYVYSCAGLSYSSIPLTVKSDGWFIDEIFDFENVLTGKISRKQWMCDMAQASIFRFYSEDDLVPWKSVRKTRIITILKHILLKRFRVLIVKVFDVLGYHN